MITKLTDWKKYKLNESEEKDYTKQYIDKYKMITHESIKSVDDIEKLVMASEGELNTFLKSKGINYPVKITKEGKYFKYTSEQIKAGTCVLGLFEKVIKFAQYRNFGGAEILSSTWNEQFYFSPEIWFGNLNINYEAQNGGSNGMNVTICEVNGYPDSTVWFNILENKYITRKDAEDAYHAKKQTTESLDNIIKECKINEGYSTDRAIKDYTAELDYFKKEKEKGKKMISGRVAGDDVSEDGEDVSIDKVIQSWAEKLEELKKMKEQGIEDAEKYNY